MAGKKKTSSGNKIRRRDLKRVLWGSETGSQKVFATLFRKLDCPSCGTHWGKKHVPICDIEECPIDHKQLLTCGHMRVIPWGTSYSGK